MAQDHFKTPPGPTRGYIRPKKSKKSLKVRAKPAKLNDLLMLEMHATLTPQYSMRCHGAQNSGHLKIPIAPPRVDSSKGPKPGE